MTGVSCKHGHLFSENNLYVTSKGYKVCRKCRRYAVNRFNRRNPEIARKRAKLHYEENPEHYSKYRLENKDHIKESRKEYYRKNSDKAKEDLKKWKKENYDKVLEYCRKRRALKAGVLVDFKPSVIEDHRHIQEGKCYYCKEDIFVNVPSNHPRKETLEHKTPLSRGGSHSRKNTVLSCSRCNLEKGAQTEEEFVSQ